MEECETMSLLHSLWRLGLWHVLRPLFMDYGCEALIVDSIANPLKTTSIQRMLDTWN